MTTYIRQVPARGRVIGLGILTAIGLAFAVPGDAAASIGCAGYVVPSTDGNGKGFAYRFKCNSPQGDTNRIDAYTIISTKGIASFSTEAIVFDAMQQVVPGESFGCEGSIPGEGFGCLGKASTLNTIAGGMQLSADPCSKRSLTEGAWRAWVVVNADKINADTGARTDTNSEPFRLRMPKCAKPAKAGKPKGQKGSGRN